MSAGVWLSNLLLHSALRRLKAGRSDWAGAMAAEMDACGGAGERLRWALGCWWASLSPPDAWTGLVYPVALTLGAGLMASYEWSNDEGPITLVLLGGVGLTLGLLRPARALISGVLLGLVVSAVLTFEVLSGLRPAYEVHPATLRQCLHWMVFVVPALLTTLLGGGVARRARLWSVR